jgi:two-component system response regulator
MNEILLVEDNLDDVELTLRAFRKSNIANEVITVRDGVEALDYLFATGQYAGRDPNALPQVVLLDLQLPRIGGLEVLQRVRSHPKTKLLPAPRRDSDVVD